MFFIYENMYIYIYIYTSRLYVNRLVRTCWYIDYACILYEYMRCYIASARRRVQQKCGLAYLLSIEIDMLQYDMPSMCYHAA